MKPLLLLLPAILLAWSGCCVPLPLDFGDSSTSEDWQVPAELPALVPGPKGTVQALPPDVVAGWGDMLDDRARRNVIPQLDDRAALFTRLTEAASPVVDGTFAGVLLCDLRLPGTRGLFRSRPDMRATVKVGGDTFIVDGEDNRDATVVSMPLRVADGDRFELLLDDRDLFRDDRLDVVATTFRGTLPWLLAGSREKLRGTCLGLPMDEVSRRAQEVLPTLPATLDAFDAACVPNRAASGWGYPSAESWTHAEAIDDLAALVGWGSEHTAPAVAEFRAQREACRAAVRSDIAEARGEAVAVGEPLTVGAVTLTVARRLCGKAVRDAFVDEPDLARPCVLEVTVASSTGGPLPTGSTSVAFDLVHPDGRTASLSPYALLVDGVAAPPGPGLLPAAPVTAWYTADYDGTDDSLAKAAVVRLSDGTTAAIGRLP